MRSLQRSIAGIGGGIAAFAALTYAGLRMRPAALAAPPVSPHDLGTRAVPRALPLPVRRYLERIGGAEVPITTTVVTWGRGTLRLPLVMGLQLPIPVVWKATIEPGQGFQRDLWLTWFGQHIVHDRDGYARGRGSLAWGRRHARSWSIDQAEQALLWLYTAVFAPTALLGESRWCWEPIGPTAARFYPPNMDGAWGITLEFDAESRLLTTLTTQRFRPSTGRPEPYRLQVGDFCRFGQIALPTTVAATWDTPPTLTLSLDGLIANVLPAFDHRHALDQRQATGRRAA